MILLPPIWLNQGWLLLQLAQEQGYTFSFGTCAAETRRKEDVSAEFQIYSKVIFAATSWDPKAGAPFPGQFMLVAESILSPSMENYVLPVKISCMWGRQGGRKETRKGMCVAKTTIVHIAANHNYHNVWTNFLPTPHPHPLPPTFLLV